MKRLAAIAVTYLLLMSSFARAQLLQTPPPWSIQVRQGDFIIQNDTGIVGAGTFTLTYRMILATGERKEFQQVGLGGAAGNGPAYNSFPLPEGWLIGVSLYLAGGSVDAGGTYAQVFVGRNAWTAPNSAALQLIGCQVSSNYTCGWPQPWRAPTDGQGLNQTIAIANPAANTNVSVNLNGTTNVTGNGTANLVTGQKHWLSNVRFTLTTSATAGTRQPCISFTDANANVYYGYCIQATQAASLIVTYDFTAGVGPTYPGAATLTVIPTTNVAATANEVQGTLPSNLQFFDATVFKTNIIGMQTGDQISAVVVRTFWSHHVTD